MPVSGDKSQLPEVLVVPRIFELVALGQPTTSALKDAGHNTWLTYQHINRTANKLARCMLEGIRVTNVSNPDGDRVVAVCMEPSADLVISLLAIHKAGAAYLPVDVTFPEDRIDHILQDSRPAIILTKGRPKVLASLSNGLQARRPQVLHLEDLTTQIEDAPGDELSVDEVGVSVDSTSIAVILYTSGSTGIPKGVRVSHKAIMNRLAWQWNTFPYQNDEVCCFKTALTFVDSISEIFGPLLTGHRVVVVPKWMTVVVEELVDVLEMEGICRLVLVPSLLRSILLHCSHKNMPTLQKLRLWVCSGEVFPSDLLHSFFKVFNSGQTICNFYGSTEVMGDVTYLEIKNSDEAKAILVNNKVPIGCPITNSDIYLLTKDGCEVSEGDTGEIFAAGFNLASGYVGGAQPDKFIDNPHSSRQDYCCLYRTGDYGRLVKGMVVFEGRADSQIKIRGHRVDMIEVELALKKVDGVDKVCVLCYKPGEVTQALVAFYTNNGVKVQPAEVKMKLGLLLQPYMMPQLVLVDDFPLLVNGKVDRQELLLVYEARAQSDSEMVTLNLDGIKPEEEESARVLLLTVARVLGPVISRDAVLSLQSSFFELGGNSLNSVLTVTSLQDHGFSVEIGQFMKAKSLRDVLKYMKKTTQENPPAANNTCTNNTQQHKYTCHPLAHHHKKEIIDMMSICFVAKGDLELLVNVQKWEYEKLLNALIDKVIEHDLSFVICRNDTNEVVASAFNFDLRMEPEVDDLTPKLTSILGLLDDVESSVRDQLPEKTGTVVHSFMMGTKLELGPHENVALIQEMEDENMKLANRKGYKAIFTTNTSALTQQVCNDLLSYNVLNEFQVNTWMAPDGTRPFAAAPDSLYASCSVKYL